MATADFEYHPLTPARWADFERLFGVRGACAGCWCMFFRLSGKESDRLRADGRRQAMFDHVHNMHIPGLLAYVGSQAVGWCSVSPRQEYGRITRSPVLKPVDDRPAWSIVCFFIAKPYRRQGLMAGLIDAAVAYATSQGATVIEAYPEDLHQDKVPDENIFTGVTSTFLSAGFKEVARRSPGRPVLRYFIREDK